MTISTKLRRCFENELPGISAHSEMAPLSRREEMKMPVNTQNATKSAVLIAFYFKDTGYHLAFIRRQKYDGVHSGQISFPGGRWEPTDKDLFQTALREAEEEIDLNPSGVEYLGKLTDLYIPPSNFIVTPYVVSYAKNTKFTPDPKEVAQIIEIPFDFFLKKKSIQTSDILITAGYKIKVPCFNFNGVIIWGATAMVLQELITLWKSTV